LAESLQSWRKPTAVHHPGKVVTDLAITLALGGDCLADASVIRSEPDLYGRVGSEATISRTITALAADADKALKAIANARRAARSRAWALAGDRAPNHTATADDPLIVDLDATLITAHSDKQDAKPTFKRGYGFHPLCAFVDHGPDGTGEPLAMMLRPGNAGSNTAADHIAVTQDALKQLPGIDPARPGRKVLIRADGGGGTKEYVNWLANKGVSYSIGYTLPVATPDIYRLIPDAAWQPAVNADHELREGADVVEITDLLQHRGLLTGWPDRMRVVVRRERPHPGAQLRFDDVDGYRLTAFATNASRGQLANMELRHRRRARCEDRIRISKDTGLANLPLFIWSRSMGVVDVHDEGCLLCGVPGGCDYLPLSITETEGAPCEFNACLFQVVESSPGHCSATTRSRLIRSSGSWPICRRSSGRRTRSRRTRMI
jgi:hypothetical protein